MLPWAQNISLQKVKSPRACAGHISLFGNIFLCSCSGLDQYFFVLLNHLSLAPGQPPWYIYFPRGGNRVLSLQHKKSMCKPSPCADCRVKPTGHGKPNLTTEAEFVCLVVWVENCSLQCLCELRRSWWPWHLQTMQWVNILGLLLLEGTWQFLDSFFFF